MGPLRLIIGLTVGVVTVGLVYAVRALLWTVTDQLYKAMGYPGFSWSYVPEPVRSFAMFVDETLLPNAFLVFLIAFAVTEFAMWWRVTHEGRVTLYGGGG